MARLSVSENSARRIAKAVTTVERSFLSSQNGVPEAPTTNFGSYLVKTPSGGIPARSGTTLGEEDCTIQIIDKSTQGVTDGETLNVLNVTDSAIAGNSYIRAVRTKSGDYIAEAGGSSGSTSEVSSTDVNTRSSRVFSTASTATNSVPLGGNPTSTSVFGSGIKALLAGTYTVEIDVEFAITKCGDEGNITAVHTDNTVVANVATSDGPGAGAPDIDISTLVEPSLRLRLYIYDSGGSYTAGTLLDQKTIGGEIFSLWMDLNYFTRSSGAVAIDRKVFTQLIKSFSVSQATLDALSGDATFYLEGYFSSPTGTTAGTVYVQFNCHYTDSQMGSSDLITIAAATPP